MIQRPGWMSALKTALRRNPVVALLGPRQCGKTTLARQYSAGVPGVCYFDLEDPAVLESLTNPMAVFGDLRGLAIIDEVQRRAELFPALRVLVDRPRNPLRFLILGSASPDLLRQSSESLAGRIEYVEMGAFNLSECGPGNWKKLWWRGGFPRSYLARSNRDSDAWREQFTRTFLERDIGQLGFNIPALTLRRFWIMAAHYHGQTWNSSEIAGSLAVSDATVRRYLDLLAGAYMVRILPPWFENLAKRQRKAPKIYFTDSGLLHTLLEIREPQRLLTHPKCGASWEGFAMQQVLAFLRGRQVYYWSVHNGPELDLLYLAGAKRFGFEFKFSDAPTVSASMKFAMENLKLQELRVVYPGTRTYTLAENIEALPLKSIPESLENL